MAHPKLSRLQETKKSDQQLGTLIARVLAHPDTPQRLSDAIGTALCDLQNREIVDTPEFIQTLLDLNKKYGQLDVTLVSCGNNKIETIKTVKEITGLSLQEAKAMVDGVPSILKEGVSRGEAEAIKKELEEQGCRIGTAANEKGGAQ